MSATSTSGAHELLAGLAAGRVHYADQAARARLSAVLDGASSALHWRQVKTNVSRTVYRGELPDGSVLYLKHFHSQALLHRLGRRLGFSDARCEMRFSQFLAARGVPAPTVLALGRNQNGEWIISAAVEPATPVDQWHAQRLAEGDHAAIRGATLELARLIGRLHASGVIHRDLHGGNILVCPGPPLRLVLMDLHRMRRRVRLSRRSRAANLAQLLHDRLLATSRSDRLRFLREYIRVSSAEGTVRGWVRMIEPITRRHGRRLAAQRDRRIFADNRYFARLNMAGYRAHVVLASKRSVPLSAAADATFTAEDWRRALADPESLFSGAGVQVVKDSASSLVVRRRLRVGQHELDVYVKRARRKHAIRALPDMFRRSRPRRAFHLGHSLLARRIYTALPLAALERRRGLLLSDAILITEAVVGGRHLNKFLTRYLSPAQADDRLSDDQRHRLARQVLWQLGRLLRRLHQEGFAHRDLKASNLLVQWDGHSRHAPEIVLVALDGLSRVRRVTARQEFRGLMRLNVSLLECPAVSHAGRLRMLLGYLRRPGAGRINFKPYWRVLQQWSSRKIRRQITARQRRQKAQRRSEP